MGHREWTLRLRLGQIVRVKRWSDMVKGEVFQESGALAAMGVMDALAHTENEAVARELYEGVAGHGHGHHQNRLPAVLDDRAWATIRRAFEQGRYVIVPLHPDPSQFGWEAVSIDDRRAYVMRRLVDHHNFAQNAAAGIVGNLEAESDILPDRIEQSRDTSPMRAPGFDKKAHDFTPADVMNRDFHKKTGPRAPGIGLAQWTFPPRRAGLFARQVGGVVLGDAVLNNMDAQVDYLVSEVHAWGHHLQTRLNAAKTVDEACDLFAYEFEGPKSMENAAGKKLPMTDPNVQAVFRTRRPLAQGAMRAFTAVRTGP